MDANQNFEHEGSGETPSFVGYRIIKFAKVSEDALRELAEILIPHEAEIVDRWVRTQLMAWSPPAFTRDELKDVFGGVFHNMLGCMQTRQLERCIEDLEKTGAVLAARDFPYEALIISLHFLEASYMPLLPRKPLEKTMEWLVEMDEFLHAALAAIATSYFRNYREELLEEAELGRLIQEGLFAKVPKKVIDLEVAYIYLSSTERARVGGDLVDLFMLNPLEAAFIIGDLSGHGLGAATDAAMLRYQFRGFMRENQDLTATMARLNRVLKEELEAGHFATALAGAYMGAGRLELVSAGNPIPILCSKSCRLLKPGGIALAVDEDATYSVSEVELGSGDIFVAYTDGLTEARSAKGFYGEDRVLEAVQQVRNAPANAIVEHLRDEAIRFADGNLTDDVAILVLKRK